MKWSKKGESLRATEGKVMKSMTRGEVVASDRLEGEVRRKEGEKQMNCQQLSAAGVEGSERQNGNENQCEDRPECGWKEMNSKTLSRWVTDVRKVWGTRKKESGNEVAKEMVREVGKMASGFAITKQVAQLSGNKGWWFVAKARRCLVEVDKKWRHKHWQWQKVEGGSSDF